MCPHEEKLTAWLLGDLSPEEQRAMTRHLDGCASCRAVSGELSRVLAPLRSGLAKDRARPLAPRGAGRGRVVSWLWRPHEGLKRAAIFTVSAGTLFALISAVYQASQRERVSADAITHIEFKKEADAAPAPALKPLAETSPAEVASERLDADSGHRNEAFTPESRPVPYPEPPATERPMPALRRLSPGETEVRGKAAAAPPASAATAAPLPPAPAAKAKRDRARAAPPIERPPADLLVRPARLAGAVLVAPTNAVSTNAAPTNAIAPPRTP